MKSLRRLYDWVISWAQKPQGAIALFLIAFAESSFFPVPPDVLLIALCVGLPRKAFQFALICAAGSVLGGVFGYLIGWQARGLAEGIIQFYGLQGEVDHVGIQYGENAFLAILVASFTPIPYKVFTLAAGFFHDRVSLATLVAASALGRSLRFFLVSALLWRFGAPVKDFIDKHFNQLSIAFAALLVGGFILLKGLH